MWDIKISKIHKISRINKISKINKISNISKLSNISEIGRISKFLMPHSGNFYSLDKSEDKRWVT
jgi:hypothetical protein